MSLEIVILAAGQGTRMRSALPKVLHPIAGNSMLGHVIHSARQLDPQRIHVVIGHGAEAVRERLAADDLNFVLQDKQLGTGHAVAQAVPFIESDTVLILYGDVPLIEVETLQRLLKKVAPATAGLAHRRTGRSDRLRPYRSRRRRQGRRPSSSKKTPTKPSERSPKATPAFWPCLSQTGWLDEPSLQQQCADGGRLSNNNAQGEYYLTDVIAMAVSDGLVVATEQPHDAMEVQGANDRKQLSELERHYQLRAGRRLMAQGVTLRDPARFDVRGEVTVGRDVLIDINVILEGKVVIEDDVVIGPNCVIKDSTLRKGVVIKANSHIEGAILGEGSDAGPFARLRPGTVLEARAHVGNFVELKNAHLGEGAKAGHLTYLGDAEVGARTNIGAGTITCNYDGANKWKTVLGEDVFIGSNNSLVAPVDISDWCNHGGRFDHYAECG